MLTLFLRAIILYILIFTVIRMMGKRQISELQPFDLVFTLLIADLASNPIGDTSIPLVYGVIPMLALFLMQQVVAYVSLKSERAHSILSGKPQVLVARGVLQEEIMRKSYYSISDLMEQLRAKDIFDIGDVAYAIIETDGTLSVLLRGARRKLAMDADELTIQPYIDELAEMVVVDGKIQEQALASKDRSTGWLEKQLRLMGFAGHEDIFYAMLSPNGELRAQSYMRLGSAVRVRQTHAEGKG